MKHIRTKISPFGAVCHWTQRNTPKKSKPPFSMTKMDYNKTELYYLQSRYYNPKSVNPIGNLSRSFLARLYRILCSSQTRTGGERLGSEGSAALWQKNGGPHKACFVGRGKAKIRVEFPACRKCNIVSCALTTRVAAVGVQRSRTVGKAHTGHRNSTTGTIITTPA